MTSAQYNCSCSIKGKNIPDDYLIHFRYVLYKTTVKSKPINWTPEISSDELATYEGIVYYHQIVTENPHF